MTKQSSQADSLAGRGERRAMSWWRHHKDRWLAPLVQQLIQAQVTANHVSLLSGSLPLVTLLATLATHNPRYFLLGLIGHVFLDGLDGALARRTTPTPHGFWFDTTADLTGVLCTALYLYIGREFPPLLPPLFATLYVAVVLLAIARNRLGHPYPLVLRPRFALYLAIIIDTAFSTHLTVPILILALGLLGFFTLTGISTLIRHRSTTT